MVKLGKSIKYYDDCEVIRYRERFIGKATIVIKEFFHPDEKSAALYAWGITICGPRETFDENEGTRRANGRADWVLKRYERRKFDFSDYQKRYGYKHNRKLLKENQLSPFEKDKFDSLDEVVATAEKAEATGSESPLEAKIKPEPELAPAPVPAQVAPAPGYAPAPTEPVPAPAYEPAPESIPIPPAPAEPAPELTPLPPAAPNSAGITDLAAFFVFGESLEKAKAIDERLEKIERDLSDTKPTKNRSKRPIGIGRPHDIAPAGDPDDDYFSGDHGA